MTDDWTSLIPTEPGWYWFYGWPWGRTTLNDKPKLDIAEVSKISNGIMYVIASNFAFRGEILGMWHKAIVPELPY